MQNFYGLFDKGSSYKKFLNNDLEPFFVCQVLPGGIMVISMEKEIGESLLNSSHSLAN